MIEKEAMETKYLNANSFDTLHFNFLVIKIGFVIF